MEQEFNLNMKTTFLFFVIILTSTHISYSQIDLPTLISNAEKAVCYIETFDENNKSLKIGTGFFIDEIGTCVTNYHVLEGSKRISITTIDNKKFNIGEILKSSKEYDIVVFKIITSEKINYLKINKKLPLKGESIVTIGNPMGLNWSASEGIISSIRSTKHINIMQITAPISQGNSGCPVLNRDGDVIGIAAFQLIKGQNLNFALHIGTLDSIKSNDAMFESVPYLVALPSDFEIAKNHIDSLLKLTSYPLHTGVKISEAEVELYLNKFIESYPKSAFGYIKKASWYSKLLEYDKAYGMYSKAIEIEPNYAESYFERANFLRFWSYGFMGNKVNEKMQIAINDLKKYGSFSLATQFKSYSLLASCYEEREEYLKAIEYETKNIDHCVKNGNKGIANLYVSRGLMYWALKNYQKANEDLDKAITLSPNCYTFNWKARILIDNEEYAEASKFLKDSCLTNYEDYYYKSLVLVKIDGDLEKAKFYIDESIKILLDYNSSGTAQKYEMEKYYRLSAFIHDELNEPIETLKLLNKMLELNGELSKDYSFCKWMIDTKCSTEDYIGMLKDVNILIESFPNKADLFDDKGLCLYLMSDYVGAIRALNKAIELNPKNGYSYRIRGLSKYLSKDKTGACADWSKAGELGEYKAYEHIKEYCNL